MPLSDVPAPLLWTLPIAVIFAREFIEAFVIVGNYRTLVATSSWDEARKKAGMRTISIAFAIAFAIAFVMILVTACVLGAARHEVDETVTILIEGVSKVIAAFSIATLSLKVPKWLGIYAAKSKKMEALKGSLDTLTLSELRFNVAWNIWREMAEIGIFLIPSFLSTDGTAIPLSFLSGVAIASVFGGLMQLANSRIGDKRVLAAFMASIVGLLATGLFSGGCHEFEEVLGGEITLFQMPLPGWSHDKFPMVIVKPFGYNDHPSLLQLTSFWTFLVTLCLLHLLQWYQAKRAVAKAEVEALGVKTLAVVAV
ncbi:hypothetical protein T492DRAFT_939467 [Pavlovales sp. CCMP2436]|nr:hypothetical protein T492DRAFT_939467 [Pavlovales sp. CCMP2436]